MQNAQQALATIGLSIDHVNSMVSARRQHKSGGFSKQLKKLEKEYYFDEAKLGLAGTGAALILLGVASYRMSLDKYGPVWSQGSAAKTGATVMFFAGWVVLATSIAMAKRAKLGPQGQIMGSQIAIPLDLTTIFAFGGMIMVLFSAMWARSNLDQGKAVPPLAMFLFAFGWLGVALASSKLLDKMQREMGFHWSNIIAFVGAAFVAGGAWVGRLHAASGRRSLASFFLMLVGFATLVLSIGLQRKYSGGVQ